MKISKHITMHPFAPPRPEVVFLRSKRILLKKLITDSRAHNGQNFPSWWGQNNHLLQQVTITYLKAGSICSQFLYINKIVSQWVNESVSQWVSELVIQCDSEFVSLWVTVSLNQWVSESVIQWYSESVNKWVSELMNQWVSESVIQWYSESVNKWVSELMS